MNRIKQIALALAVSSAAYVSAYDFSTYTPQTKTFSASDYREALNMGLKFFGGQRCGDTHNWMLHDNKSVAKKYCHMKDGQGSVNGGANGSYDLTGGWHDCGDHIKVGVTMGSSAVSLLVAYDVWPKAFQDNYDENYGAKNGIPDVLDEVKVATDYFIKSFLPDGSFCYYVGSPGDHNVWMTSSKQSSQSVENGGDPRPVWTATDKGGPQAANYVSALCLMAIHYPDNEYKLKCKEVAVKGYEFAKATKSQHGAIPMFYSNPNTEWADELALSALMLYRLTGDKTYWEDALGYMKGKWENNYPIAWDTMTDYVYYYIAKENPNQDNGAGGKYVKFLEKNVFEMHIPTAEKDPNGFPYYSSRWGTNKLALGGAIPAALYVKLVEDEVIPESQSATVAENYCKRIVSYVMGDNEFGHTFLHGFQNDFTFRLHHRNAMGRNDNPPTYEKNKADFMFASGGVIGGPSATGVFENIIEGGASYTETEGGCDYNAPFVAAIASIAAKLCPVPSSLEDVEAVTMKVYPTVFSDYLIVDPVVYDGAEELDIKVINSVGQVVMLDKISAFSPVVLNTSSLNRGIYFVEVANQTYKVIK